jgi:hypothetical protein
MSSGAIERDVIFFAKSNIDELKKTKTPKSQKAERENLVKFPGQQKSGTPFKPPRMADYSGSMHRRNRCLAT